MIGRRTAINVAVFFAIAVLLVLWGITRTFGNPLAKRAQVSASFSSATGLHSNFPVSFNGVVVGKITSIDLHGERVHVNMRLDPGAEVPENVRARVLRASAAGEQRVDLTVPPGVPVAQKHLRDGDVIPAANVNPIPPDIATVIDRVTKLFKATKVKPLNRIIHESALSIAGRSTDLQALVRSGNTLLRGFLDHQQSFKHLMATMPGLLDDLNAVAPEFRQALDNTEVLTKLLANQRTNIVELLRRGNRLAALTDPMVLANQANVTCIFSDLADVIEVFQGKTLQDFSEAFAKSPNFFNLIPNATVMGPHPDIGLGAPGRNDQWFLRSGLSLPVGENPLRYTQRLPIHGTYPGAACRNVFGAGVGPVTQNPMPKLVGNGKVVWPAKGEEYAPKNSTGTSGVGRAVPAKLASSAASPPSGWAWSGSDAALLDGLALVALALLFRLGTRLAQRGKLRDD